MSRDQSLESHPDHPAILVISMERRSIMRTQELVSAIDAFINNVNKESSIISLLVDITHELKETQKIQKSQIDTTDNGLKLKNHEEIQAKLKAINAMFIKDNPLRQFFRELDKVESAIDVLILNLSLEDSTIFSNIKENVSEFGFLYDTYFTSHYSHSSCIALLNAAGLLSAEINSAIAVLTIVRNKLAKGIGDYDNDSILSLILSADDDFNVFVNRLESIICIYEIICKILDVDNTTLRIIKVESGSVEVSISGVPECIDLLKTIIMEVAGFFHRNYTTEGKTTQAIDKIDKLLLIKAKLNKEATGNEELKALIHESSVKVAGSLYSLLGGTNKIDVNGKVIIDSRNEVGQLSSGKVPLLLESGSQKILRDILDDGQVN